MKRIIEIDCCNPDCKYNGMISLDRVFCFHPIWEKTTNERRRIPYSKLTDKKPFPTWCPLPEKVRTIEEKIDEVTN